jgi:hypothetical protein
MWLAVAAETTATDHLVQVAMAEEVQLKLDLQTAPQAQPILAGVVALRTTVV